MTKYKPLEKHLGSLERHEWSATFSEVEKILGFVLPPSARKYNSWWATNNMGHGRAWERAGWRARHVNTNKETVTFVRIAPMPMGTSFPGMRVLPHGYNAGVAKAVGKIAKHIGVDSSKLLILAPQN